MIDPMLRYDEALLVANLRTLRETGRAIFAASCAERMLPVYWWFHERTGGRGNPTALESALGALWDSLLGTVEAVTLEEHRNVAEELVPYEDDSWVEECAFAQHAAATVAYAIRCRLSGNAEEAGWAARQVYEAIDLWVADRDDVDFNAPGAEVRIATDPLIQAELKRQRDDIEEIGGVSDNLVEGAPLVVRIRGRARTDGMTLLGFVME